MGIFVGFIVLILPIVGSSLPFFLRPQSSSKRNVTVHEDLTTVALRTTADDANSYQGGPVNLCGVIFNLNLEEAQKRFRQYPVQFRRAVCTNFINLNEVHVNQVMKWLAQLARDSPDMVQVTMTSISYFKEQIMLHTYENVLAGGFQ